MIMIFDDVSGDGNDDGDNKVDRGYDGDGDVGGDGVN